MTRPGCTLVELLTGERPFVRATAAASLAAVLNEPAPNLLLSGLDLPPRLADIAVHCLEKDRAHRFSSARDLATALRALLTDSSMGMVKVGRRRARTRSVAVLPFVNAGAEADAVGQVVGVRLGARVDEREHRDRSCSRSAPADLHHAH